MPAADRSYVLVDPRPIADGAPYTFFLPTEAELAAIAPDDQVKLAFEYLPAGEKWEAERMWVTVISVGPSELIGELDNNPDDPAAPISLGEEVSFQRYNVIDISWSDPRRAPESKPVRQYWERCFVDDCVLDGTLPVGFLWREEPEPLRDGDKYPDSGWRIRGRLDGFTTEELGARSQSYVALGLVLNRDDSWLRFVDASIGTELLRDFVSDTYIPSDD